MVKVLSHYSCGPESAFNIHGSFRQVLGFSTVWSSQYLVTEKAANPEVCNKASCVHEFILVMRHGKVLLVVEKLY